MRKMFAIGLTLVMLAAASGKASIAQTQRLKAELTISGHDHDLAPIVWLGVSRAGTVVILERQTYSARFFDLHGREIGRFGREGSGPREFRDLNNAGWLGDTLWIADGNLRRITLIGPDARYIRTIKIPELAVAPRDTSAYSFFFPLIAKLVSSDGSIVGLTQKMAKRATDTDYNSYVVRVSPDRRSHRIIWTIPGKHPSSVSINGTTVFLPFHRTTISAFAPGADLVAQIEDSDPSSPDVFHVAVIDGKGVGIYRKAVRFSPVRVPRKVVDSTLAAFARTRGLRMTGQRSQLLDLAEKNAPKFLPPVTHAFFDRQNRLWLQLQKENDGTPWLILSDRGQILGKLYVPLNVTLRTADASRAWGIMLDEFDVPSVVRYRYSLR